MKNKLLLEDQVVSFLQSQPPETRRRIRGALHDIERGEILLEPLDDELEGFYKMKIDRFRILLRFDSSSTGPVIKAVFAEKRSVVYELFKMTLGLQ